MRSIKIRILFKFFFIASLSIFLFAKFTPLASLGEILNPYSGIFKPPISDFENLPAELKLSLKNDVHVEFEKNGIPHIFAKNDSDLYFIEGYLEARDRLWPMDFVSRVASGRLSEVFGKKTLSLDQTFVELRIPEAAEESLKLILQDQTSKDAVENFSAGVNYYIDHLSQNEMPLEFKIFGYSPEHWSPYKTALLEKFMAFSLAGFSRDLPMTRNRKLLSQQDFEELFPEEFNYSESIVSKEQKWKFKNPRPQKPLQVFQASLQGQRLKFEPNPSNGSNNWAVFGKKSATGFPILSNDIHLDLALPSMWYQVQLVSPTQNIYGISLAGAPGVVIGFSKKIAWAVTNASSDFMDWYELKFKDSKHQEYLFDGEYRKVEEHEHIILVKGSSPVHLRLKSTHFGPIVFDDDKPPDIKMIPHGLALQWTVLQKSNELLSLLQLNHSQSLKDCDEALNTFGSPSQNFVCADINNDVKMGIRGNYPSRYKGEGKLVSDGSRSESLWGPNLDPRDLPFELNPSRSFVFSANQKPTQANYPAYLGQYYESPFRAQRIHQILSEKEIFSPEDIQEMQKDTYSVLAQKMVPIFLSEFRKQKLEARELEAINELSHWNFKFDKDSVGATVFDSLWQNLERNIWSPYFPDANNYAYPTNFTTSELIAHDLGSKWLNSKLENFGQLLHRSLAQTIEVLEKKFGSNQSHWAWKNENLVNFDHLAQLPMFSNKISSAGDRFSILAVRKKHGPAWKMVVSLGPNFQAWGIYPGGQSADPRSPHAHEFLGNWSESKLLPLEYLEVPSAHAFKEISFLAEKQ